MKYILGIDTSSTDLGIGLYGGDRSIASYSRYIGNSHAEHINPALHMILTTNRITPDTISHIAIAVGPGSFTGLRIGIAFTKGFCIGTTTRILPLSSLFILAHAGMHHKGRIVSAIDARNDCVFWATFTVSGGKIDRLTEDKLSTIQSFTPMLATDDLIVTDTMGYKKSTIF